MNDKNKSLGLNPKLLLGCHQDSFLEFLALMRLAHLLFFILAFAGCD